MPTPILSYAPPYGMPSPAPPPGPAIRWEYHSEIVGLRTADTTPLPSLAGLTTAGYFLIGSKVEIVIVVDESEEGQSWVLRDGPATGSDVAPDDYDGSSNDVRWEKVS